MTDKEKLEILDWFAARAGDHIPDRHYQYLFPELARILGAGDDCKDPDKAIEYMELLEKA